MSMTLNLVDHQLAKSHRLLRCGRDHDARQILNRLSRLRCLPADSAEETQARLAQLNLEAGKFRKARRHLTAALAFQPNNARYHYLMAGAHAGPANGDKQRAAQHYRRALEIDPNQPDWLSDYGLLMLRLGQADEGLRSLRRAVELAPHDADVLQKLVDGLEEEGEIEEIRRCLQAALFRKPRDGRFRQMWDDFQFQRLCRAQARRNRSSQQDDEGGPAVLPFVRPPLRIVRHDGPAPIAAPHRTRRTGLSIRKAN